ncbi:MAG: FHA domain-containing protein, partial [Steroidobacteraceae bacterium]
MILVEPAGVRREISIETSPFRIGRQTGNELVVRDSRVSRQQAQIIIQDGIVIVEDLGSRHGTFVNGERVTRHQLSPQDAIEFGVPDSHRLIYAGEETRVEELLERMELPAPPHSGSRELYHL